MSKIFGSFVAVLALATLISGCATVSGQDGDRTFSATELGKVSGGEGKASVIKKLGGKYTPIALEMKDGHKFEVLEFERAGRSSCFWAKLSEGGGSETSWTPYWVYFMDDKLVKYERAEGQALLEHTKWMQEIQAMASTIDAFKGTAAMPYQVNANVKQNVNVQGNMDVNVRHQ